MKASSDVFFAFIKVESVLRTQVEKQSRTHLDLAETGLVNRHAPVEELRESRDRVHQREHALHPETLKLYRTRRHCLVATLLSVIDGP